MGKYKTLILHFVIIWLIFFLLSMIAKWLNLSSVDLGSILFSTTIIAVTQGSLIGFNKKYSLFVFPSLALLFHLLLVLPNDPMGNGKEAAITSTEILSPYLNSIIMSIIDRFTYPVRAVLFYLDTTMLTWLYLFLVLFLAKLIIKKTEYLFEANPL